MTDQHQPDERPADDAVPPPERGGDRSPGNVEGGTEGGGRRAGRPPITEGATVPLKRTPPAPPTAAPPTTEPDGEDSAPCPPQASGSPPPGDDPAVRHQAAASDEPAAGHRPAAGDEPAVRHQQAAVDDPAGAPPAGEPGARSSIEGEPTVVTSAAAPRRPAAGEDLLGGDPSGLDPATTDHAADGPAGKDVAENHAGSPDVVTTGDAPRVPGNVWPFKKFVSAGVLIWVLLALFGFTLVVQLRSNDTDEGLASARQDDLVRILSDLEARDTRLQAEIAALETSQRQLTSGVAGRQAALAEAEKRADELGLLAGTLPGRGRGLEINIDGVRASAVLNAVQELRGAGGEVMQLSGADGAAVRIVASTYFVDAEGGGIVADGKRLTGPYRLLVIGVPQTMQTALEIPGGVVASVKSGGGSVTMEQRNSVDVTALREATSLQYARPVS